jgi:hypothetical protein
MADSLGIRMTERHPKRVGRIEGPGKSSHDDAKSEPRLTE